MIRLLQLFSRDARGVIAVTFAVAAMAVTIAAGCAIDYSGASLLQTKLHSATDMTVLTLSKSAATMSDDDLRALATRMLRERLNDSTAAVETLSVTDGRKRVELKTLATYNTSFMGIAGFRTMPVRATSASFNLTRSYEMALVIDNSGSMNSSAGGASKMASAKDAASRLITAMTSTQAAATNTRFSLVPFTLAVKVGSEHATASWMDRNGASSIHWNTRNLDKNTQVATAPVASRFDLFTQLGIGWAGCVETRPGTYATSDVAPSNATPDSLFVPMFAPDEPGIASVTLYYPNGGGTPEYTYNNSYLTEDQNNPTYPRNPLCPATAESNYVNRHKMLCKYKSSPSIVTTYGRGPNRNCNAQPLLRLTSNTATVNTAINNMVAGGSTNLLEGFMWGWRTLSPNAPFADGKAYSVAENKKILILLTDGMNAWGTMNNPSGSEYSSFGYYNDIPSRFPGTTVTTAAQARSLMDNKTLDACTNAKNQGIQVYTVGFSVSTDPIDEAGLNLLRSCASASDMAYVANDSSGLVSIFEAIARNVVAIRIAM